MTRAAPPTAGTDTITPSDDAINHFKRVLPHERVYAGFDGEKIVAGTGAFPFDLIVPGGQVKAAGVTITGVLPTHRRRGYLRAMMRSLIDDARARGEPVAVLWATEDAIYGHFGYGMASMSAEIDVPRDRTAPFSSLPSPGDARLVALDEAEPLVAPVYDRVARVTPGMFARSPEWWQDRVLNDMEWKRRGGGFMQCVVLEIGGKPAAYVTRNAGKSWKRQDKGLQKSQAWFTVKRQAMATDRHDPVGVYFGTTNGEVYISTDEGDSWECVARNLPEVYSVEVAEPAE